MSQCLCIIPARGGSKRIPRKNALPLNGVPLISYTIRAARVAEIFSDIIVSTDNEEISRIALSEGASVDHRPETLCGDEVTMVEVIKEILIRTQAASDHRYVAALLPTCPFRSTQDIKSAYKLLTGQSDHQFLIGTTEYDFPIQLALEESGERTVRMLFSDGYTKTRSQSIAKRHHPNGAMYLATTKAFLEKGTFFQNEMLHYSMPAERSLDIDYPYQFELAEIMAKRVNGNA